MSDSPNRSWSGSPFAAWIHSVELDRYSSALAYLARFDVARPSGTVRLGVLITHDSWALVQLEAVMLPSIVPSPGNPALRAACDEALRTIRIPAHLELAEASTRSLVPDELASLPIDVSIVASDETIFAVRVVDVAIVLADREIRPLDASLTL